MGGVAITTDPMTDVHIELHACDPARNRYRAWRVVASADLFGLWTAHVTFGRIGAAGRTIRHEFSNEAAALGFIRRGLRRLGAWGFRTTRLPPRPGVIGF